MTEDRKQEIINYVKTQLGYPVVNIEVTDEMIEQFIHSSVIRMSELDCNVCFASVPAVPCQEFKAETVIRVYNNTLTSSFADTNDIFSMNVVKLGPMGNMRDIIINQAYQDYSQFTRTCSFKFHDDLLYIDGLTGYVTVEYIPKMEEVTVERVAFDWVRRYTLALTKECLGRIRGKYTSQSSPFTMDHENLLNEASDEKQRLEDEIQERGTGFFFVDSDY